MVTSNLDMRDVDSKVTKLGHLYHAYVRSGDRRFAQEALEVIHHMEEDFADTEHHLPERDQES